MHGYTGTLDSTFRRQRRLRESRAASTVWSRWICVGMARAASRTIRRGRRGDGARRGAAPRSPEIPRAHVVGYSLAAIIAGRLATKHPDRPIGVAFRGTGADGRDHARVRRSSPTTPSPSLESGVPFRSLALALQPPGRSRRPTKDIARWWRHWPAANDVKALAALWRGFRTLATPDTALATVRAPMIALIGSEDGNAANVPAAGQGASAHPRRRDPGRPARWRSRRHAGGRSSSPPCTSSWPAPTEAAAEDRQQGVASRCLAWRPAR